MCAGVSVVAVPLASLLRARRLKNKAARQRLRQHSAVQRGPLSRQQKILPGTPTEVPSQRLLYLGETQLKSQKFQNTLFYRFQHRYGELPVSTPEYRDQVRQALYTSDLDWLYQEMREKPPGTWDFVFPPAPRTRMTDLEAWCRSPLAIMVRPRLGYSNMRFLPDVTFERRKELIRSALECGISSPHFEGGYWATPAIINALNGDIRMLQELHRGGLDMESVKVEWAVYEEASFTVAHAAALHGHAKVLQWLADTFRQSSWLDKPDAAGCTPLYYAVSTARSAETARVLLRAGCSPFRMNTVTMRSPLSVAIEFVPEVAAEFLAAKSQAVFNWWGNPVVGFDFEGVAVDARTPGQLKFRMEDTGRTEYSIEQLIARMGRTELAAIPIISRLNQRKWDAWAGNRYWLTFLSFIVLTGSYISEAVVGPNLPGPLQLLLTAVAIASWIAYGNVQWLQVQLKGFLQYLEPGWRKVDALILLLVPFGAAPHVFDALDFEAPFATEGNKLLPAAVAFDSVLILLLCLRLLRFASCFSEVRIGLYLNTVLEILTLSWQPLLFLNLVVLSFSLCFVLIFRLGAEAKAPGYGEMVVLLWQWVLNPGDAIAYLRELPPILEIPGLLVFIVYFIVAVLGSLQLLQESANVVKGGKDKEAEENRAESNFQTLRADIIDGIESALRVSTEEDQKLLNDFYSELQQDSEQLLMETRAWLWPRRSEKAEAKAKAKAKSKAKAKAKAQAGKAPAGQHAAPAMQQVVGSQPPPSTPVAS